MTFETQYSAVDRLLHRMAFSGLGLQRAVADLEDRLYRGQYADITIDRPVFITSLPRAGTTLLLEVVSALEGFSTHTYREMPFLLCPLLWNRVSGPFHRAGALRERAHGDGMTISYDSAEAFEEVLWRTFWADHYHPDRIDPWSAEDVDPAGEFEAFFANHIRKVLALRGGTRDKPGRYVSKNNANVSRVRLLDILFPECLVIVPFRNPLDHVDSLLRQHENFLEIHAHDPFALRYMESIGHFEFGAALRPIDFGGWLDRHGALEPNSPAFWLTYWCEAFAALLDHAPASVTFVSYERCCSDPDFVLDHLGRVLGLDNPHDLGAQAAGIRTPRSYPSDRGSWPRHLVERAHHLHAELLRRSTT